MQDSESISPKRENAEDVTSALKGDATAGGMNSLAAAVRVIQGQLASGRLG
jgi:hypothetical protein